MEESDLHPRVHNQNIQRSTQLPRSSMTPDRGSCEGARSTDRFSSSTLTASGEKNLCSDSLSGASYEV